MPGWEIDLEAEAIYLNLNDHDTDHTDDFGEFYTAQPLVLVDYAADGTVRGVEILGFRAAREAENAVRMIEKLRQIGLPKPAIDQTLDLCYRLEKW